MRSWHKFLFVLLLFVGISFFGYGVSYASTPVGGSYSSDQHWTLFGSPYIVEGFGEGVIIESGATLTIDPGVIVKLKLGTQLWADGAVIARGTAEEPIIFTSFYDDSIGGDTDGTPNTTGSSGDWWRIGGGLPSGNPHLEFDYALIRYAGAGFELSLADSPVTVTNSTIENGGYGFRLIQNGSGFTIENNIIRNNSSGFFFNQILDASNFIKNNTISGNSFRGAYNQTPAFPADMRNNSWGDPSGPFHPTLNPAGLGNQVTDGIFFDPWSEKLPPPITPVIIIPGMYGTELWNGDEFIWANLGRMFTDLNDQFLTENLGLDGDGNSLNSIEAKKVIEKMAKEPFAVNIFENLIKEMLLDGYETGVTLFTFPYDWRLDLETNVALLNQKIQEVKLITGASKVDLIAHSMGGLLAKDYLNQYSKGDIGKLVFVGTPHLGAPKAAKAILFGDRVNIPWLEDDRIQELAHNSIAAHELLPNRKYFDEFTGYLKKFSFFQQQPILDYDQTKDFLLNDKGLNSTVFAKAEEFFSKHLEDYDFSGVDAYNIAGCKTGTQAGYKLGINNSYVIQTKYASGDGTVPLPSADYIGLPANNKFYVKNTDHAELPSTTGVRELILGILQDQITLAGNISNSQNFCNFKGKELLWRSPVAVHIYASGRHTGPIENNGIEYGVPGVDYDIIGEEKFIFLPTDEGQTYQIIAQGLADSTFDLLISENTDGEVSTTNVFNDVAITPQTIVNFDIAEAIAPTSIQVDLLGNGESQTIPVSSQLTGEQSQDVVPPQTQADISGPAGLNGWYTGPVMMSLTATDDNSGILETRYSLDGGLIYSMYSSPAIITAGGIIDIRFYSVDKAGNNENIQTVQIKIDQTPPEIAAQFNITTRDFQFSATDNLDSNPILACVDPTCQAEDRAGNKTVLTFKKSSIRGKKNLSFKNLRYNDQNTILLPDNSLLVSFSQQKGQIKTFSQTFSINKKSLLGIIYDPKKDQSVITDWSSGSAQTYTETGVKFLQVLTDRGILNSGVK